MLIRYFLMLYFLIDNKSSTDWFLLGYVHFLFPSWIWGSLCSEIRIRFSPLGVWQLLLLTRAFGQVKGGKDGSISLNESYVVPLEFGAVILGWQYHHIPLVTDYVITNRDL